MPRSILPLVGTCVVLFTWSGCGDPPTSDDRGYTKAPLEVIGVFIDGEQRSDVRDFMRLNLPDGRRIAPPEAAGDTTAG